MFGIRFHVPGASAKFAELTPVFVPFEIEELGCDPTMFCCSLKVVEAVGLAPFVFWSGVGTRTGVFTCWV
jgi:p-aminobenzoyl-glutamate transporter AbgT